MKKKTALRGLVLGVFVFSALSCGRVGVLWVEAPEPPPAGPSTPRIHYFFDRTGSMQGFTANPDESAYIKTLPEIWDAAERTFPGLESYFYEYGETYISKFKSGDGVRFVKKEILEKKFYGTKDMGGPGAVTNDRYRDKERDNKDPPFASAVNYIKTEKADEPDSVFVIVTDLYDQGAEDPFSLFYSEAFSRGRSAAFFAVESSFSGTIYSLSDVKSDELVNLRVPNGKSTFFICIAGDSALVSGYCEQLAKELNRKAINFDSSVFIVEAGETIELSHNGDPVMAGNPKRFVAEENLLKRVNIRSQELQVAGQLPASHRPFESYQLLTNTGSRWSAGLDLPNINPASFNYRRNFSISHFDGRKVTRGEPASFSALSNSTDVDIKLLPAPDIPEAARNSTGTDIPLYLVVETKNRSLKQGWYKIGYEIVPDAIVRPAWVSALYAEDIPALKASIDKNTRVKTLNLAIFYERIAEAYNKLKSRSIYADELYHLKR